MSSSTPVVVTGAVEGSVDEAILRRVVQDAGADLGPVYGRNGKAHLQRQLRGYNRAARLAPWVVLVDLDEDAECAPPFVRSWLPNPAVHMCFRVAVREAESWLLADREQLAQYLGVSAARIPGDSEAIGDPKQLMVELARRSRRRNLREDMVPRKGSGRTVGPAYASRLIEFVEGPWRPAVAARRSDSLRRLRARLTQLVRQP